MVADAAHAIVANGPASARGWRFEKVKHRPIRDDEVLVRMIASGICHADVHFGDAAECPDHPAIYYPRVLGHEGCGYVEQVGDAVTSVKRGAPVLLSYASCGKCCSCTDSHPAYCTDMFESNFVAERATYGRPGCEDFSIGGGFFGQSSIASLAVVRASSVVNLTNVVKNENELKLFAPLGCGIQTGTAAMLKVIDIQAGQDVAVIGVGSVGLSAVMAASMLKCRRIIAIDRSSGRLRLAKTLGATHTIEVSSNTSLRLAEHVRDITDGNGLHGSLDTTGVHQLARQSYDFVRNRGRVVQVGLARPQDQWDIPMSDLMNSGKQILGCVQGDAIPQIYALEMMNWYRQGKLPIDKLVTFYDAQDFMQALRDMRSGSTIKPVLVWPRALPTSTQL